MKTIVMKSSNYENGYCEVFGHMCQTEDEMRAYCQTLDPDGKTLKVVDAPYDPGKIIPQVSETRKQLDGMFERADDAGKERLKHTVGEILKALEKPF